MILKLRWQRVPFKCYIFTKLKIPVSFQITKNCFYFLFVTFGLAYAQIELNQEILQKEFNMMPTVTAIELTANVN